jgi:hypothetical protein
VDDITRKKLGDKLEKAEEQIPDGVPQVCCSPMGVQFQVIRVVSGRVIAKQFMITWDDVTDMVDKNGKTIDSEASQELAAEIIVGREEV